MDAQLDGVIARQVGVDRERNTVMVWVTFDQKETLYNFLETEEGKDDHGKNENMEDIIETFEMFDMSPVNGRLTAK
jgi:hypothetical protein